jgi:hypothetical protein
MSSISGRQVGRDRSALEVHLARPYGMRAMRARKRVKNDSSHAYELATCSLPLASQRCRCPMSAGTAGAY